jgi:hypothetical protein
MDTIVIVLIFIIIILLYSLYYFSKKSSTNIKGTLYDLNKSNTSISSDSLTNPSTNRFSYSAWVYVNTWNKNSDKLIYSSGVSTSPIVSLTLGKTTPDLKAVVEGNSSITITNNFPIQKWVHIVISVDSNVADCYLDGKLVVSRQLATVQAIPATYNINFGTFDAYLTGLEYISKPLNPQEVWSKYMAGNGYSGGKYGVDLSIKKDDSVISQVSY